jgi:flagellar hook-associated protein 1 FlgK
VESVLAPGPGEDLSAALDTFWDAWESVANKSEDLGLRYVLQATASSLTDTFRGYVERLNSIRISLDQGIKTRVEEVNNLTKQIAEYNRQISVALAEDRAPNDLLDSRDVLLDRLSALTGAMPANSEAGDLIVYLDGRPLVQSASAWELSINAGAGGLEIRSSYDNAAVAVGKGEVGGLLYARDTAIPGYLAELDAIAGTLVAQVNAAHQTGFGLDGVSGRDFFVAGSTAGDIVLDPAVLADVNAIAAGATDAPGDGTVALVIAKLRTTPVMAGRTLNEVAQALIGMIGKEVYAAEDGIAAQEFALEQIRQQQQSIAGVSIDEEISYLMMTQRAYEAAARIVKAADEMVQIILERLGV